ncbi:MAG: hypothetical protein K0R52_1136 [Alphaproteobacteria bacterium]|jgi:uncharacterized protein with HEPN domain|nr:hypothetical protein [Alphaproteobacteria bacterium]
MTDNITLFLDSLFKVAKIHADRLSTSVQHLQPKMPLSFQDVEAFTFDEMLLWEMFVNRFSKLQDLMGAKIFKAVIDYAGESTDSTTLIDRINILEKLGIIDDSAVWKDLREMRNHLAHEYPDAPETVANYLNQAFSMTCVLMETLNRLEAFVETLRIKNKMAQKL